MDYQKMTEDNLRALDSISDEVSDTKLLRAVQNAQNGRDFTGLWDILEMIVSTDNPGKNGVATDRRSTVRSRYKSNRERWETVCHWVATDTSDAYADLYREEQGLLSCYLTQALVDLYREATA